MHLSPYPHFFIENLFPEDFYQELLFYLPETSSYTSLAKTGKVDPRTYEARLVLPLEEISHLPFASLVFWNQFALALQSQKWLLSLQEKFHSQIESRFKEHSKSLTFSSFAELVRDRSSYAIGPHTDHPIRVITLLFYLPKTGAHAHLGTSIYKPKDPSFTCEGFSHHKSEGFEKVATMPFIPNSLFGFCKSDRSFHGVEPILEEGIERNLLNYYLKWERR